MRTFLFLSCFFLFLSFLKSQSSGYEYTEAVKEFVGNIRNDERQIIASGVTYPFRRDYPVPDIKDSAEFIQRFSEVFDPAFIRQIVDSRIPEDWSQVGWRGIMLSHGILWLDQQGRLTAVNYQSEFEKTLKKDLITAERLSLAPSLQNYKEPICIVTTEKYRVRVDKLENGNYRYASWKKNADFGNEADLVLQNGEISFDGSGGNHSYTFKSGQYTYEVSINVLGEIGSAPASLIVMKSGKILLNQAADLSGN